MQVIQAHEHDEHFKEAMGKKKKSKVKSQTKEGGNTSEEREALIDKNAMLLAKKLKAIRSVNLRKRKAQWADEVIYKRRKVTTGNYRIQRVFRKEKDCVLFCFDRRGGLRGSGHTHLWRARV